jgi:cytochrome c-type biogenesis protein CcmH
MLPVAAFGLYFVLGNPMSLTAIAEAQANPPIAAPGGGEHDIMAMIQKVEEKTKSDPNDGEAWTMLAKTYAVVGHWPEALSAYEKAIKLKPDVPAVMTGYAEALAISRGRELKGEPIQLVLQALEKDPDDFKGLELAAINAFQEKNYAQATFYFKHLYKLLPPESPYAQDIAEAQKEATRLSRSELTGMDNLADLGAKPAEQPAAPGATLHGEVDIAPALKAKVAATDIVFLFARSAGGGAPVAAIRSTAGKFPLEFELSDAMAMNPDNKLSNHKEVTLTARISKSGQPMGAAGDLEGTLTNVKVGTKGIKLVIDKVKS